MSKRKTSKIAKSVLKEQKKRGKNGNVTEIVCVWVRVCDIKE